MFASEARFLQPGVKRRRQRRQRWLRSILWLVVILWLTACNLNSVSETRETPPPTSDIPRARILSPENNAQISLDDTITLEILAQDDGAGIHQVRLFVDDPLAESEPYAAATAFNDESVKAFTAHLLWTAERSKSYLLTVVSYRADGTRSDGVSISVHVNQN